MADGGQTPGLDAETLKHRVADYGRQIWPAVVGFGVLSILTGCLFPLVLLLGARLFPDQAGGSLLARNGAIVGSRLIGQAFSRPEYFHPRPSAAGAGYDASASGGSNLGPANPKLLESVRAAAEAYRRDNALPADMELPIDAVTSSASGLDPDISPANAALQVARVARARGVSAALVRRLLAEQSAGRQLGLLGDPRVRVLTLNLALDRAAPLPHR